MVHIGMIGGIGPAAQDFYTRALVRHFAEAGAALELTTAHADTPSLLAHQGAGMAGEQAAIFARLTERLARAGAQCVVVPSMAGHFCRAEFAAVSVLPVVDMIAAVAADVAARGLERIGVLGTRVVMETRAYGGIAAELLMPEGSGADMAAVHGAYVAMAAAGVISPEQQSVFDAAASAMMARGAQAIMLGGTDLALAYSAASAPFPLVDCAAIHVRAVVELALNPDRAGGAAG